MLTDNKNWTFTVLDPVSLSIKSRLWSFWYVECKDDADWLKRCMKMESEGTWQRGHPRKTWWDCVKADMENFGLSHEDAQDINLHFTSLHCREGYYATALRPTTGPMHSPGLCCCCCGSMCVCVVNGRGLILILILHLACTEVVSLCQSRAAVARQASPCRQAQSGQSSYTG